MDKVTSDERLLKLIEGASSEPKRKQGIGVSPRKSFFELMQGGKFNLNLKSFKEFKFNLAGLNKGLIALAVIVTLILIYSLLSGPVVSASNAAYFTPADASAVAKVLSLKEGESLAQKSMLNQEMKRNIFLAPGVKPSVYSESATANLAEVTKDLKLVGIIWSATPEIMIEYGKDSRTYVLKKGDSFIGDMFKVKEISRSSATLEISTEGKITEYELR